MNTVDKTHTVLYAACMALYEVACLIIFHHLHVQAHGFDRGHVPELVPALPFGALHNVPAPGLSLCAGPDRGLLVQGVQDEPQLIWNGRASCMGCTILRTRH